MRDAAFAAARWACDGADCVGILTGAPDSGDEQAWSLDGFGVRVGDGPGVPLEVGMARWFLQGREAQVLGPEQDLDGCDAVLVMGDGSASRSDKAPMHLDPRAVTFDDSVLTALAAGDFAALARLDLDVSSDVGASGAPAWERLGRSVDEVTSANVDAECDPYGVLYVVARWTVWWAVPA